MAVGRIAQTFPDGVTFEVYIDDDLATPDQIKDAVLGLWNAAMDTED